jgi:hypothetical protein
MAALASAAVQAASVGRIALAFAFGDAIGDDGKSIPRKAVATSAGVPKLHVVPMTAGATLGVTASLDGW